MLSGKKILIGITGSIAAYKIITLTRLLIKEGVEVKIIVTPAATDFVSTLTLSTLSKNKVLYNLFDEDTWANHVMLGRWADVMLIAPLSCNTLSKMATGACDNLLLATYLSATCPVVVAPAMDEDMWHHPAIKQNIESLKSFGNKVIDVNNGELASGLSGDGRMAEPEEIIQYLKENFFRNNFLQNKKAIVTAGPTYENIDPVRFIGNHSSGKMGYAIAESLYENGAEVILISGSSSQKLNYKNIKQINVQTAAEMYDAVHANFDNSDIAVMCAAVADYTVTNPAEQKIKKAGDEELILTLAKTKDILASIGRVKNDNQFVVGFALETNNEKENAIKKLKQKNADIIVLNSSSKTHSAFRSDTNAVTILDKDGTEKNIDLQNKKNVANEIVEYIISKQKN